jgi:hypothetical protein
MKNEKLSAVKCKWIGIRLEKSGRAAKKLKDLGFFRMTPAQVNNRNAWNWARPCAGRGICDFRAQILDLVNFYARGFAAEFTDIQWKHNAGLTDLQWRGRIAF